MPKGPRPPFHQLLYDMDDYYPFYLWQLEHYETNRYSPEAPADVMRNRPTASSETRGLWCAMGVSNDSPAL